MADNDFDRTTVSTSKLYMLRCVIAMAHADGQVCDEERAYIHAIMNRIPLTKEQRDILDNDLDVPHENIAELFAHINDPKFRSQVIYFARIMAYRDGVLSPSEEELLNRLHIIATDGLNMDAIRADVKQAITLEMNQLDIKVDKFRPEGGLFGLFDRFMLWMDIDLMRE